MATIVRTRKKRPCSICGRWFEPNPRAKAHQRACGAECQKELAHRRQADWRKKNPDYDSDRALRRQLDRTRTDRGPAEVPRGPVGARIPWRTVQTAVGPKMAVELAFALREPDRGRQTVVIAKKQSASQLPARLLANGDQTGIVDSPAFQDDPDTRSGRRN